MSEHTYDVTVRNRTQGNGDRVVKVRRDKDEEFRSVHPGEDFTVRNLKWALFNRPSTGIESTGNGTSFIPLAIDFPEGYYNLIAARNGDPRKWEIVFKSPVESGEDLEIVEGATDDPEPVNVTLSTDEPPIDGSPVEVTPPGEPTQPVQSEQHLQEELRIAKRKLKSSRILLLGTVTAAWIISPAVSSPAVLEIPSIYVWIAVPIASVIGGLAAWFWRKGEK